MSTNNPPALAAPASEGGKGTASERPASIGRRVRRWSFEIAIVLGIYAVASAWQERDLLSAHSAAPAFDLQTLDGGHVSLDSLRGKRVLLHFWATWCDVCQQEHGALNALQSGLAPDEAVFAIVADSDDPAHLRQFAADEHIHYPVLLADNDTIRAFHIGAFPTNYFIDPSGRIVSHTVGMSTRYALRARLALSK